MRSAVELGKLWFFMQRISKTMDTRGLNLDHLRSFLDVIELGSFSAAAQKHHLTQPAISQQVRQLERRFGVRLAERVGRRVSATAAGTDLLAHIRAIDAAVVQAFDAVGAHAAQVHGRLRLGTGATACTYLLPPVLASLKQRFPELEIVVSTGNTNDMLRGIEHNTLDIGLVTLPAPGRMFDVTPVLEDEFVAIFPSDGPPPPVRITPAVLAVRPMVLFEPGALTRRLVDDWFEAAGLQARPTMELGSTEAMKEIVAAGLGCAVLPRLAVTGPGARKTLVVRSLSPRLHRKLAVVMRRDKPLSHGLRHLSLALKAFKLD